jgi:hypothetical protein
VIDSDHFKLGCANRTLGMWVPQWNREAGEAIRTRLQGVGVSRESGHERFDGSEMFPRSDEAGNVAALYGRKIRDNLSAGTAYHMYLPGRVRI